LHFKKGLLEGLDTVGFIGHQAVLSVAGKRLGDECCLNDRMCALVMKHSLAFIYTKQVEAASCKRHNETDLVFR
jgi:hypothetical protein